MVERRYQPEYRKYGGSVGVSIAEDVFCSTSQSVLRILSERPTSHRQPLGYACQVFIQMLGCLGLATSQVDQFLTRYAQWWTPYSMAARPETLAARLYANLSSVVADLWAASEPNGMFSVPALNAYTQWSRRRSSARNTSVKIDPMFLSCLANYIHTTNNLSLIHI